MLYSGTELVSANLIRFLATEKAGTMIEVWQKYLPDGGQVFYRLEGNEQNGFISMATVEGKTRSDQMHSKERPTRADVEKQFASYVRGKENQV